MDRKLIFLLVALVFITINSIEASKKHKLVVYWGQNAVYNMLKGKPYWEKDLEHFCKTTKYDTVVLAFMHIFFDARQKDSMPGMNFAFHCEKSMSADYPFLLRCPKIEAGIKECQSRGKQVLMSLGGASGSYGFQSDSQAKVFAGTIWNLLLEGNKLNNIRPFGSEVLDGVDLDIEGGSSVGYSAFIKELRTYTNTGSKKYIIAAAPQCPFPDAFLGPSPGKALQEVPTLVDEIYIQFYNNYCHTGDAKQFYPNLAQWLGYSAKNNGPMIYVGMPSHERAAYGQGYWRTPSEVNTIYQKIKDEPRFGGFMLWDASFDQNNVLSGRPYSEHIVSIMGANGGTKTPVPPVTIKTKQPTVVKTTPMKNTKSPATTDPAVTTDKPTNPGKVSCKAIADGMYPHPTDCSKFLHCHSEKAVVKSCPPGLNFNPTKKYCDWPSNVNC